jgi:hypothetical protein
MDLTSASFVDEIARRREKVRKAHPRPEESAIRRAAAIDEAEGFDAEVTFTYPQWFQDGRR